MPLFIIAVVYGLLWKRANWQGAVCGYIAGSAGGAIKHFYHGLGFNLTTFIPAAIALVVTPIVSLMTTDVQGAHIDAIWKSQHTSDEEIASNNVYRVVPTTPEGKAGFLLLLAGFGTFLTGVLLESTRTAMASAIAMVGMFIYFSGGLVRTYTD